MLRLRQKKAEHKVTSMLVFLLLMFSIIGAAPNMAWAETEAMTLVKTVTPVDGECMEYDIVLGIYGDAPDKLKSKYYDIVLVIDNTGSMGPNTGSGGGIIEGGSNQGKTKFAASQDAAKAFAGYLSSTFGGQIRLASVLYSTEAESYIYDGNYNANRSVTDSAAFITMDKTGLELFNHTVDNFPGPAGNTNIISGLNLANELLDAAENGGESNYDRDQIIVLMSDGVANRPYNHSSSGNSPNHFNTAIFENTIAGFLEAGLKENINGISHQCNAVNPITHTCSTAATILKGRETWAPASEGGKDRTLYTVGLFSEATVGQDNTPSMWIGEDTLKKMVKNESYFYIGAYRGEIGQAYERIAQRIGAVVVEDRINTAEFEVIQDDNGNLKYWEDNLGSAFSNVDYDQTTGTVIWNLQNYDTAQYDDAKTLTFTVRGKNRFAAKSDTPVLLKTVGRNNLLTNLDDNNPVGGRAKMYWDIDTDGRAEVYSNRTNAVSLPGFDLDASYEHRDKKVVLKAEPDWDALCVKCKEHMDEDHCGHVIYSWYDLAAADLDIQGIPQGNPIGITSLGEYILEEPVTSEVTYLVVATTGCGHMAADTVLVSSLSGPDPEDQEPDIPENPDEEGDGEVVPVDPDLSKSAIIMEGPSTQVQVTLRADLNSILPLLDELRKSQGGLLIDELPDYFTLNELPPEAQLLSQYYRAMDDRAWLIISEDGEGIVAAEVYGGNVLVNDWFPQLESIFLKPVEIVGDTVYAITPTTAGTIISGSLGELELDYDGEYRFTIAQDSADELLAAEEISFIYELVAGKESAKARLVLKVVSPEGFKTELGQDTVMNSMERLNLNLPEGSKVTNPARTLVWDIPGPEGIEGDYTEDQSALFTHSYVATFDAAHYGGDLKSVPVNIMASIVPYGNEYYELFPVPEVDIDNPANPGDPADPAPKPNPGSKVPSGNGGDTGGGEGDADTAKEDMGRDEEGETIPDENRIPTDNIETDTEITDNEIPLLTNLPKAGGAPGIIWAVIGTVLLLLGLGLSRKEDKI